MGLALRSAGLAAAALIRADRHGETVDADRLRSEYRRLWRIRSAACRALALAVSCKPVAAHITPAANGCDSMASAAIALMGK
jgi:hypothetical protein